MAIERGENSAGRQPVRGTRAGLLGSLKDALRAAGREETAPAVAALAVPAVTSAAASATQPPVALCLVTGASAPPAPSHEMEGAAPMMSAAEAARHARTAPARENSGEPPTTRVVRAERTPMLVPPAAVSRTQLIRGRQKIARDIFAQDPVVAFVIVVGGPGLGASRPVFEGNNSIGRGPSNRVPLDFGDETISSDEQAYIRYDSVDRSFLFVPNLAKTNVVSVNDKRPTGAVELKPMDIVTFGRTQVAFLPFCGPEFDWSEISDTKDV